MKAPILVFGMPRSGTTWIGKLFDSHPDTLYRHEPDSSVKLKLPLIPKLADASLYRAEINQFVASIAGFRDPKVVGKQPIFAKSYEPAAGLLAYRASVLAAKAIGRIKRHPACLYRPTGNGHAQVRLVWKSIESYLRLRICVDSLPGARAIYLVRHPCGFVASQLRGMAARNFPVDPADTDQSWMLKQLVRTLPGQRYRSAIGDIAQLSTAQRLAWEWLITQETVLADVAQCDRVLTVQYEDVCAEPLGMMRRLFEFVGLAWHPQTESFVRDSTHVAGTGYYSVFKHSHASAERWRTELAPDIQDSVLEIARSSSLQGLLAGPRRVPMRSETMA